MQALAAYQQHGGAPELLAVDLRESMVRRLSARLRVSGHPRARDALAALGVDTRPSGQAYDDRELLRATIVSAGLTGVEVTTVTLDLALNDVDEVLLWLGTHGARAWLAPLAAAARPRLRAVLRERWPGTVPMTWQRTWARDPGRPPEHPAGHVRRMAASLQADAD